MADLSSGEETFQLDVELDRLEQECSKLVALLRDRHVGLSTWRYLVGERAQAVQRCFTELGMVKE